MMEQSTERCFGGEHRHRLQSTKQDDIFLNNQVENRIINLQARHK